MKLKAILLGLILSISFCQGQESFVIGEWVYINISSLNDSIIESSVNEYRIEFWKNRTFEVNGDMAHVKGKWVLKDSVLIMSGSKVGEDKMEVQKMTIHSISDSTLSFIMDFEDPKRVLINYGKVE